MIPGDLFLVEPKYKCGLTFDTFDHCCDVQINDHKERVCVKRGTIFLFIGYVPCVCHDPINVVDDLPDNHEHLMLRVALFLTRVGVIGEHVADDGKPLWQSWQEVARKL